MPKITEPTAAPSVLSTLREPFPAELVKKNQDGLDYVSIDGYINRFLEVLRLRYDFEIVESQIELLPEDLKTRSGKRQYLAQARGYITIYHDDGMTRRSGVGADVSHDPDKAVKTAQAEAFKKAAHQFGVALELWDEEHREKIEEQRKLLKLSDTKLKQKVFEIAKRKLEVEKPSVEAIAEFFDVVPGALADRETLLRIILEAEG